MDINTVWQAVEPYIMTIVGALGGGTVVFALVRILVGGFMKRFAARYDTADMANKVAEKLAGKTLNIDVTAVTEKRLDRIEKKLLKKVEAIEEQTAAYKHLLALIGGAVSRFKAVTKDERSALTDAITALESDYVPPEPENVVTLKLEPLRKEEPETDEKDEVSLINFEGLKR